MEIIMTANCGNSPKNAFIELFVQRLIKNEDIDSMVSDDFEITVAGNSSYFKRSDHIIEKLINAEIIKAKLFDAISHGKKGAMDFQIITKDNTIIEIGLFIEFKTLKADKISTVKIIHR